MKKKIEADPVPSEFPVPDPQIIPEPEVSVPFLQKIKTNIPLAIMAGIAVVAFIAGLAIRPSLSKPVPIPTGVPTPSIQNDVPTPFLFPTSIPDLIRGKTSVELGNITWLPVPVKIGNLQLLKKEGDYTYDGMGNLKTGGAVYYHVANLSTGGRLINIQIPIEGPNGSIFIRIIETPDRQYIAQKFGEEWNWNNLDLVLLPAIKYTTQTIPGLDQPETIIASNITYSRNPYGYSGDQFSDLTDPQKLTDSSAGPLYQVRSKLFEVKDLYARQIYLRLNDGTVAMYNLKIDLFSADKKANVTWSDGRTQPLYDTIRTGGCGGGPLGLPVINDNSLLLSGIKQVGTTKSGDSVYQIIDPENEMLKFLYEETYNQQTKLTIAQYAAAPSHFIWKDPLNDWQIFISQDYMIHAECAKPVIYLYPETPLQVSVKVAANIRLSDPQYPQSGWSVLADPSGKITYQGREYPYLFWDGTGKGVYPDVRDQGVVVAGSQVGATLKDQLSQLGLNAREAADFMEFWLPLIPDSPFVRLTWLGTEDMNRLAPLEVTPRPDTVIRVFLEFEGMDRVTVLTPQKLNSPARRGFTLVEWGGLLN